MTQLRGFILQASYRIASRSHGQRVPVIHIYGILESGGTFLVRDDRQRPHFFIRAADVDRAQALRVALRIRSGTINVNGALTSAYASAGGHRMSGVARERGIEGLRVFQQITCLTIGA